MKENLKYKMLLICFIIMCFPVISLADDELILPEYTEEYKMWMELPDEEKQNYIEPQMYEMPTTIQLFSEDDNEINVGTSELPPQYQRTDYGQVKNQGNTEACWAYSASTVFETNYYVTNSKRKTFSNTHMDYITAKSYNSNGFNRLYNSGGNMGIAIAYATNGMGIALDSDMITSNITAANLKNVKATSKVSDYEVLTSDDIKQHIYKYGVVSGYTYISGTKYFSSSTLSYNNDLAYYCSDESLIGKANHEITIVGWDDNYINSAFPDQKGAYLVLNSYGSAFGSNGLYHIFYNDVFLKDEYFIGVTKTDDIDYEQIYQYDPYGQTAVLTLNDTSSDVYAANVFERQSSSSEVLNEVGIYYPIDGAVTVYINANGDDKNIKNATYSFTTDTKSTGYHTIELPQSVKLTGDKFTVCVKYRGYVSVELSSTESRSWYYTVTSNAGESFISSNGTNDWQDLKTMEVLQDYSTNLCIKAFTTNDVTVESTTPTKEYTADLINYVFDYKYYADYNLDLYNLYNYNEAALRAHWENFGKAEGRKSSCVFDVKYYVDNNSDLAMFKDNYVAAYNHFMNYGYAEYRKSSAEYDGNFYRNNNADLKNMTSMELIRHYSMYGKNELRQASTNYDITKLLFDASLYAELNPDVVKVCGYNERNLQNHWYLYGIAEGRIASLIFDGKYYLKSNKDLAQAYGANNYSAAYTHFLNYGFIEGRQASPVFSIKYYLVQNSDLKSKFGSNKLKVLNYFSKTGKNEARLTSSTFSVIAYRSKNGDLKNAYGENYERYFVHYLKYGQKEKRVCI